jgi:hypothetical protein
VVKVPTCRIHYMTRHRPQEYGTSYLLADAYLYNLKHQQYAPCGVCCTRNSETLSRKLLFRYHAPFA